MAATIALSQAGLCVSKKRPNSEITTPPRARVRGHKAAATSSDMAALMEANATLVKERDKAFAHAEMLDSIVPSLEAMRNEMKALLLEAKAALLEAGVPKRQKS